MTKVVGDVRWHRGLPYRADLPFDAEHSRGTLARAVVLRGITVPAGTEVWRDIDAGTVWGRASSAMRCGRFELRDGDTFQIEAKPRGWVERLLRPLHWALVSPLVVAIAVAETANGRLRPSDLRGDRPRLVMVVLRGRADARGQEGRRFLLYEDQSVVEAPAGG